MSRLSRDWPHKDGELKGGMLSDDHLIALVDLLYHHDAILHCCAVDVSLEDPDIVQRHKAQQCANITKHLTAEHAAALVAEVWELRGVLEKMPPQLYLQSVVMFQTVWLALQHVTLFFAQRKPRELGSFKWIVDAKDPARITTQQNWWRDVIGPLGESRSRREPFVHVADPSFNYSYFERNFGVTKDVWYPDAPRKTVDGINIKKLITDHISFLDSRSDILIQAVDVLTRFMRRALAGAINSNDVLTALGRLQVRHRQGDVLQTVHLVTLAQKQRARSGLAARLQKMTRPCTH